MTTKLIGTLGAMMVCVALTTDAQTKFDQTRTTLEKWVETRQIISKERAEWDTQKQSMQQLVELLERERQLLTEQIEKAEALATQADRERQTLIEDNEALSVAGAEIRRTLEPLEKRVLELSKAFPQPLMERIDPLFKRLPAQAALTRLSISERMQNIIGILSEVDKFNNTITVISELKQNQAGRDVLVKTMYLGLGAAFFVDSTASFAGLGTPTLEGWTWTTRNDLGNRIAKTIFIYENAAAAVFVPLPVTIALEVIP